MKVTGQIRQNQCQWLRAISPNMSTVCEFARVPVHPDMTTMLRSSSKAGFGQYADVAEAHRPAAARARYRFQCDCGGAHDPARKRFGGRLALKACKRTVMSLQRVQQCLPRFLQFERRGAKDATSMFAAMRVVCLLVRRRGSGAGSGCHGRVWSSKSVGTSHTRLSRPSR